jgi:hypothetical protein
MGVGAILVCFLAAAHAPPSALGLGSAADSARAALHIVAVSWVAQSCISASVWVYTLSLLSVVFVGGICLARHCTVVCV